MVEVALMCALVREGGADVVHVDIDNDKSVSHLKDAIKTKMPSRITCDTVDMHLFLATQKQGKKWLSSRTNAVKKLKMGQKTDHVKTLMKEDQELQAEDSLKDMLDVLDPPLTGQIHVLVVTPEGAGEEKTSLTWRSKLFVPRVYDSSLEYFMLQNTDMDGLGLPQDQVMLYCRPAFHSQFDFLTKQVLDEGHLGYILGPPGSGKSITAAAFALTIDMKSWMVTWIHATVHQGWWCVRLVGDERQCASITAADLDEVLQIKDDRNNHLVLVDGWTLDDTYTQLTSKCMQWLLYEDATMKRRLSFICSVASRGKIHEEEDIRSRASEFAVESWTLEEYLEATTDGDFFSTVLPYLDVAQTAPVDRAAAVTSKYYYAGGSCRNMFCFSTAEVIVKLLAAVSALNDIGTTATLGQRSSSTVNRLFAMFRSTTGGHVTPVISQCAATTIGIQCGPEAIKKFMTTLQESSNPALNGWMLEIVFFASLQNGGVTTIDAAGNTMDKWPEARVVVSDGVPTLSTDHVVWIKPEKWNQGGYDAIMVCKRTQLVRMVQVTSAHTHTFRIDLFSTWLLQLSRSDESFEVKTLEIVFLVERQQLTDFKITKVEGEGMLVPFKWPHGKEKEKVTLAGNKGFFEP